MLRLVRDELRSEIRSSRLENGARFDSLDAKTETMNAQIFEMKVLVEEQNANNRIVLEGLQALWQRQDRVEQKLPR